MKNLEEMKALKAEEMAQVAGGWTYWMPQESDGVGGNSWGTGWSTGLGKGDID